MNSNSLRNLIERLRTISLIDRIFHWRALRNQLIDAATDLQQLNITNDSLQKQYQQSATDLLLARQQTDQLKETIYQYKTERQSLYGQIQTLQSDLTSLRELHTKLLAEEDLRKIQHEKSVATLHSIQQMVTNERRKEQELVHAAEIEKLNRQKETWYTHQELVKQAIKTIGQRHTIEYIEKAPFKGDPDNTLKICDEFVIFDAKSPASDDLFNFPGYLKDQAERARKYAKQENVKTDLFFVVPSNTLDVLRTTVYRLADYTVYIISTDALEPIISCLKKIEDYEFAKELSPEERENICRIIGKFGHLSKRRIQVDLFFAKQFIQLGYKTEADLPADIFDKVMEFEKSEKLNPPIEKRAKSINIRELGQEFARIREEATAKGISINDDAVSDHINELPLYLKQEYRTDNAE